MRERKLLASACAFCVGDLGPVADHPRSTRAAGASADHIHLWQITSICEGCQCRVLAVGGMPDHVHLLLTLPSTISVSDLMKRVKGGSSRFVSETLAQGEWFAWQGSYGATAVCERDKEKIVNYIANQKKHHADGTLWPTAEKTQDDDPIS